MTKASQPLISRTADENGACLSDPPAPVRLVNQMTKVDRIDNRGDIREHLTRDGSRTLCGLTLGRGYTQNACGNRECRRCEKIAARCQNSTSATSSEQKDCFGVGSIPVMTDCNGGYGSYASGAASVAPGFDSQVTGYATACLAEDRSAFQNSTPEQGESK
jgi:hypothetical protein